MRKKHQWWSNTKDSRSKQPMPVTGSSINKLYKETGNTYLCVIQHNTV